MYLVDFVPLLKVSNGPIDERNEDLQEEVSRLRYNLEQKQKEVEKVRSS